MRVVCFNSRIPSEWGDSNVPGPQGKGATYHITHDRTDKTGKRPTRSFKRLHRPTHRLSIHVKTNKVSTVVKTSLTTGKGYWCGLRVATWLWPPPFPPQVCGRARWRHPLRWARASIRVHPPGQMPLGQNVWRLSLHLHLSAAFTKRYFPNEIIM